jgi:hypothetical protein
MFIPDSSVSRWAVFTCFIAIMGVEAATSAFAEVNPNVGGPILMLCGETERETEKLMFDYGLIMNTLQAVAEGRAINVSSN